MPQKDLMLIQTFKFSALLIDFVHHVLHQQSVVEFCLVSLTRPQFGGIFRIFHNVIQTNSRIHDDVNCKKATF